MLTNEALESMKGLREWCLTRFRRRLGFSPANYKDMSVLLHSMSYMLGKIDQELLPYGSVRMLDLGAGFSTLAFRMFSDVEVSHDTVDHDPKWLSFVRELLSQRALDTFSMFSREEFIEMMSGEGEVYDAILVDHGPTMDIRLNDLEWISKLLKPKGIMFIDDFRKSNNFSKRCIRKLHGLGYKCVIEDSAWAHSNRAVGLARRA